MSDWNVGDICQTPAYGSRVFYKVVNHIEYPRVDLEIIWIDYRTERDGFTIPDSWTIGVKRVAALLHLVRPNEMIMLALAAEGEIDV